MHTRAVAFALRIARQFDVQGVETSTMEITCCSSRDVVFFSISSLTAYATLRGLLCTTGTDMSMAMSYSPGKHPKPDNTACIPPTLPPCLSVVCRSPTGHFRSPRAI